MSIQVKLLGSFEARSGATGCITFPTSKTKALFAYLAMAQDQGQSRERLSTLFWGETSDTRARANLRQALTRIRQSLPTHARGGVVAQHGSINLDTRAFPTDTQEFERLSHSPSIEGLEQAAALYRGDLLEDLSIDAEPFETWLLHERQRYRERAIDCFERLLDHYRAIGAATRGIEVCNRLLALDPYRESVHRLLINFYADQERRGAALHQFEECRRLLAEELGVEPEQETVELYEDIKKTASNTKYSRHPELSRPATSTPPRQRTSSAVTDLVSRSPWQGANWSKPSVAVLPFDCLSNDGSTAYVCDGIVEDLITNLARFQDLHVIARNSAFAYYDRRPDLRSIGRELGVHYIVEGSLQEIAVGFRVTAQLIEADTGFHVWAECYDQDIQSVANLRDLLARQIAGAVIGRIENHQLKLLPTKEPESWEVYECWLRGMDLLRKVSQANINEARGHFKRALEIDPTYARAYAGLAMSHYKAWSCLNWTAWWKLHDEALPLAQKAFELDENDHQVHCILGIVSLYTGDLGKARFHLERAERINPNDARTLANASNAWTLLGESERAVRMAEQAVRLDPFHPDWYLASLGFAYFVARDYERAIAAMELASDGLCDTRAYLAAAYGLTGDKAAAEHHAAEFVRTSCESLGGDPDTDIAEYLDAVVNKTPYKYEEDRAHFLEGLRLAGLPTHALADLA